jgi:hypothetical protein
MLVAGQPQPMLHRDVAEALARQGLVDLAGVGDHPTRVARRNGLTLVQRGAAVAATQPVGPLQLMHASVLAVPPPRALLSAAALWAHGAGPLPAVVEVGVPDTRGLSLRPPVVGRRLAPDTLARIVVRRGLPVVPIELAVLQCCAHLHAPAALALIERLLRRRATTPRRLRDACRRGLAGSAAVRTALRILDGGDLELQKRRLRAGLEATGLQLRSEVHLVSRAGGSCYLDLLHEPSRTALEVDGGYHDLAAQRAVDRRRDRWVAREHDISVVRVADEEVRRGLAGVVAELLPHLRAA